MTEHLCRHHLEQLVADDPRPRVHPALRVHLAACDECSLRKRALEAARAGFLAAHPAAEFARAVVELAARPEPAPRPRWSGWRTLRMLASALGLLAVLVAALLWRARAPAPPANRMSGGASLQVFATHAGTTFALRDGQTLSSGDRLALEYSLDRPRHLLLLGVDDAGAITRYFPAEGARDQLLAATSSARLSVGIELDARKGEQRLYGLFTDATLDEAEARGALIQAFSAARAHGAGIAAMHQIALPAQQVTLWFRQ
jgi:hypothetical protein